LPSKKRLILIGGNVASGKTSIAKQLASVNEWVFLDKDDVGEPLLRRTMFHLQGDPHDRDSDFFINHIRHYTYKTLLKVSTSILKVSNVTVVATAPFTHEFHSPKWLNKIEEWCTKNNVELFLVWVDCSEITRKERIIARGSKRDLFKLANWKLWHDSLAAPPIVNKLIVIDNEKNNDLEIVVQNLTKKVI
jgi:predicted kinase